MLHTNIYTHTTINAAFHHDKRAMEALYRETYGTVYSSVRMMLSDEYAVEDIVQDAFIKGFQNLDQLSDPQKYPSWMKRIAVNQVKDYYRKHKPILFTQMENDEGDIPDFADDRTSDLPETVLDRHETARLVSEILDELADDQRAAIVMFYYQEMSVRDIAAACECSEGTIKSRLNYGRKKIESKVRALERKGTKLYGLAPIPFMELLFRDYAAELAATPAPEAGFAGVFQGCAAETASSVSASAGAAARQVAHVATEFVKQHVLSVAICAAVAVAAIVAIPLAVSQTDDGRPSSNPPSNAAPTVVDTVQDENAPDAAKPIVPADGNKIIYRIVKEEIEFLDCAMTVEYEYHPDGYRLSGNYTATADSGHSAQWQTVYHYNGGNPLLPSDMQLYDSKGSLKFTYAYEYNDQNQLVKQTRYNGDIGDEIVYVYTCSYNENGQKEYMRIETCYGNWTDQTYHYDGDRVVGFEYEYMPKYYDPMYPGDHSVGTVEFVYDDAAGTLSWGSTAYCLPTAGSGGRYREIFDNEQFDDAGNVVSYDLHRYDDEYLHREFEYAAFEVPKDAPLFNDLPTQYSISGNSEFELSDFTDALYVSFSFWISDTSLDDFHFYITRGEG